MTFQNSFHLNRRAFLGGATGALGALALEQLLQAENPIGAKPRRAAPAKAVICLFQHGGPSQVDLFDPKPELIKRHGQPYAGELETHFDKQKGNCLASPFQFKKCGQAGIELCEHLPHTAEIVDDLTVIRSMTTFSVDHETALRLIHAGQLNAGSPTMGSWLIYALGSENKNLPAYVVLSDPGGLPVDGIKNWSSGWLPAVYQGVAFRSGSAPVPNLALPEDVTAQARSGQLRFLKQLNAAHQQRYPLNTDLAARIENFEVAARMQTAAPAAVDLSGETEATKKMYGLDNPATREYGGRCLTARRLVESGVRFVQLFMNGQPWDTHSNNAKNLERLCARTDQPCAALIKDLKQRGLLDSTIVLWGGEFGRLPVSQGKDGRDHNRHCFTMWVAGGGFKRGYLHGRSDDFGYKAVEDPVNVHDLHATLLHALGLDHRRLTYVHDGRAASLSDADVTGAKVVPALLA